MMSALRNARRTIIILASVFLFLPSVAFATCCKCTAPSDVKSNICINTSETDCQGMPGKSVNVQVKALNCGPLDPSQCQPVAKNGVCTGEPQEEFLYSSQAPASGQKTAPVSPPTLGVSIPGLQFAQEVTAVGGEFPIPFFAQYVTAAYTYLIGLSAIAAAIMIVWGGFLYIFGATGAKVKQGKTVIVDAVIGLVLVLGAYMILNTINPDTLNLQALRVKIVYPGDPFIDANQIGYKDSKGSAVSDQKAAQIPGAGTAPAVEEYQGEKVSIEDIKAQEDKAKLRSQLIADYCTKQSDRGKLQTYDEKIQALVRVVLGFYHICIEEKGCAYVRGGGTDYAGTGKVNAGASDVPFLLEKIRVLNGTYEWPSDCEARYFHGGSVQIAPAKIKAIPPGNLFPGPDCTDANTPCAHNYVGLQYFFYKARAIPEIAGDFEYNGTGRCYKPVFEAYQKYLADKMTDIGLFGGDCGTTLAQMYSCAGGKVGRPQGGVDTSIFNYINYGGLINYSNTKQAPGGKDFIVWRADSIAEIRSQLSERNTTLKFGDIIVAGTENHQHNFMFTGGRADVPFEIFEMGGGGENAARACPPELGGAICGMAATRAQGVPGEALFAYIDSAGTTLCTNPKQCGSLVGQRVGKKTMFPVTIVRPYDYSTCLDRSQCGNEELCLCGAKDPITCKPIRECEVVRGARICKITGTECKCAMQNICRKVRKKASEQIACKNDEQCPNGETCVTDKNVKDICGETPTAGCFKGLCFKSATQ